MEVGNFGTLCLKLGGGVECYVGFVVVEQHLYVLTIYVTTLALLVRAVFAAFAHTFVDSYAQPCQCFVDVIFGTGNEAGRIGVLDAENHVAAMLTGKKIVI